MIGAAVGGLLIAAIGPINVLWLDAVSLEVGLMVFGVGYLLVAVGLEVRMRSKDCEVK